MRTLLKTYFAEEERGDRDEETTIDPSDQDPADLATMYAGFQTILVTAG